MKLLTIDDSRTLRNIIKDIGNKLGYEVLEAEHGKAAFKLLLQRADEVGLILLDWNMPGMNGLEVLKTLKAADAWKHIPVMMVTTEGEKSYIIEAVRNGAIQYVTKPFTPENMAEKIKESLGMGEIR
ncbi:MAG: response regulator [Magnetococcales bacterium]|nr:response regulator [Magnetococcales bacterium]